MEVRGSLVHTSSAIYKHTLGSVLHSRAPLLGAFVDEMAEFLLTAGVFSFSHVKGLDRPVDGGQGNWRVRLGRREDGISAQLLT